jgi:hypothetical protein
MSCIFALTTPRSGSLTRDQHAAANVERPRHLFAVFVKKLHRDAMARAKFGNAKGVGVIRRVD